MNSIEAFSQIIKGNDVHKNSLIVSKDLERLAKIGSIDWEELEDAINSIAGYSMEEHDVSRETVMATKEFIIVKRFIDTIKGEK